MSVWYNILENLAAQIETVLQPYNVPVVVRRRDVYLNNDALPICIIAPGDSEKLDSLDFADEATWEYPVIINLVYPDNRTNDVAADAQEYLDIRQAIRDQIYFALLEGVESVWDNNIDGTKPFAIIDQKSTYSTTKWITHYKSLEPRRSS